MTFVSRLDFSKHRRIDISPPRYSDCLFSTPPFTDTPTVTRINSFYEAQIGPLAVGLYLKPINPGINTGFSQIP